MPVLVDTALDRVDAAGALAATDTGGVVAVDGYTPAITDLLIVSRAGFDPKGAIDDGPATATDFLATAQEAGAHERDLITALAGDQALVPEQYQKVTALASEQEILAGEASDVAEPALAVRIDRVGDALAAAGLGRDALFFATPDQASIDAWLAAADVRVDDLRDLRDTAATLAVAAVDDLAASSRQVLVLSGLAVIATLLISGLLVRGATRSIARPLQDLAAQAEEVALSRLPDAVRAQQDDTGDVHLPALRATGAAEVREVAGAFNDVQDTALRLAGEQAVLRRNLSDALTNLGRRNQALLGRQLDFISSLEKRETDPAFLDHLFRLDHLASRMRRNAESLLILAGSETPRRRRKPAVMSEIVRASMSEVEGFERVRLGQLGDATLTGPVVIDLVHLLAELIENAFELLAARLDRRDRRPFAGPGRLPVGRHRPRRGDVQRGDRGGQPPPGRHGRGRRDAHPLPGPVRDRQARHQDRCHGAPPAHRGRPRGHRRGEPPRHGDGRWGRPLRYRPAPARVPCGP